MADRLFWPALVVDADGIPHPMPACEGDGCRQGRKPAACNCYLAADGESTQVYHRRANLIAAVWAIVAIGSYALLATLFQVS